MSEETKSLIVPDEIIMNQIYYIRGHKAMLDTDLAVLYEVETKRLKDKLNATWSVFLRILCLN